MHQNNDQTKILQPSQAIGCTLDIVLKLNSMRYNGRMAILSLLSWMIVRHCAYEHELSVQSSLMHTRSKYVYGDRQWETLVNTNAFIECMSECIVDITNEYAD